MKKESEMVQSTCMLHPTLMRRNADKRVSVTILLLRVYATGNDSRLLRKRILFSCTNRYGSTISSDSTELACLSLSDSCEVLSLQIVRWVDWRA